jgi:hypothetical protein
MWDPLVGVVFVAQSQFAAGHTGFENEVSDHAIDQVGRCRPDDPSQFDLKSRLLGNFPKDGLFDRLTRVRLSPGGLPEPGVVRSYAFSDSGRSA